MSIHVARGSGLPEEHAIHCCFYLSIKFAIGDIGWAGVVYVQFGGGNVAPRKRRL